MAYILTLIFILFKVFSTLFHLILFFIESIFNIGTIVLQRYGICQEEILFFDFVFKWPSFDFTYYIEQNDECFKCNVCNQHHLF